MRAPGGFASLGFVAATALAASVAVGCGGDGDEGARDALLDDVVTTLADDDGCDVDGAVGGEPVASVRATLGEYTVALAAPSVPGGVVEVVAENAGRIDHEVMIVRIDGNGDPGALALNPVGGVDMSQVPPGNVVGKIWAVAPGGECSGIFEVLAGSYALICNLVDDGTNPHYGHGMYTTLTVT